MRQFKNSVFFKLMFMIVVISLIPLSFLSYRFIRLSTSSINYELVSSYKQIEEQYSSSVNRRLERYYDILGQITINKTIQRAITNSSDTENAYIRGSYVSQEVTKYISSDSDYGVENCMVYSAIDEFPIYNYKVTMIRTIENDSWYYAYMGTDKDYFFTKVSDSVWPQLSLTQSIIGTDFYSSFYTKELGFIKLDIDSETLFSPFGSKITQSDLTYQAYVLSDDNEIIYSTIQGDSFNAIDLSNKADADDGSGYFTSINGNDVFIINTALSNCGLNLVVLFPTDTLLDRVHTNYRTAFLLILLIVLFIVISSVVFAKFFSLRLNQLLNKMKYVEHGDLTITAPPIKGNDELALIDRSFKHMVEKLSDSINKNYIIELEKKEAQLHSLQLQINPHFLYNTLETISAIGMTSKVYSICNMCEHLGSIFRYSTNKEQQDIVTVEQELNHTKDYVYIQKMRFQDKFEVSYQVKPSLLYCMIPRFILQPLVENAILHGLKDNAIPGHLDIIVDELDQNLIIMIMDDGVGMTDIEVDALNSYINENKKNLLEERKSSIGVKNVNLRIQLSYGYEYGVTITSKKDEGTCCLIKLPLHGKKEV